MTKSIEITKIYSEAKKGANIRDCIKEAIILASENWANVELIHNNRAYIIYINDIFLSIQSDSESITTSHINTAAKWDFGGHPSANDDTTEVKKCAQ